MGKQTEGSAKAPPDHTLTAADIPADDAPPQVFAVANLKAFLKPPMHEELSAATGGTASAGTEMVCRCVPVEQCVCDTVDYPGGCSCNVVCTCQSTCSCQGTCRYWHPY